MEIHHVSLCAITQILVDMVFLHLFKMLFLLHMCEMLLLLVQFSFCKVPPLTSCPRILFNLAKRKKKQKKSQINLFVLGIYSDMVERYHNNERRKKIPSCLHRYRRKSPFKYARKRIGGKESKKKLN